MNVIAYLVATGDRVCDLSVAGGVLVYGQQLQHLRTLQKVLVNWHSLGHYSRKREGPAAITWLVTLHWVQIPFSKTGALSFSSETTISTCTRRQVMSIERIVIRNM